MAIATQNHEVDQRFRQLRTRILAGRMRPGMSLPPERHLTREWGVSLAQVRAVLGGLAHEGLLKRVQGKGTFVADPLPRSVLARTIIVVNTATPEQSGYLQAMEMLHGISDQCRENNLKPQLHQISDATSFSASGPEEMAGELQDELGVIILPIGSSSPMAILPSYLHNRGVPCVKVGWPDTLHQPGDAMPQVNYDRQLAARMVTKHAVMVGRHQIAYLAPERLVTPEMMRIQGFLEALSEHGISLPPGYLVRCDKQPDAVRQAISRLMSFDPRPNAICCSTGRMAIMAIQSLLEMRLRVPEDVAVVAAISSTESDAYSPVPLTRVVIPGEACGRAAVRILNDLIAGKPAPESLMLIESRLEVAAPCPEGQKETAIP